MARSHSTEKVGYTNPEVRFERNDVQPRGIAWFGVFLGVGLLVISVAMTWYGQALARMERTRKFTDLPPAAVDKNRLPPEPRLEAIDDVRLNKYQMMPPRAAESREEQRLLRDKFIRGDGIMPMEVVIPTIAGKLPARKSEEKQTPMPSAAASGRTPSGSGR